MRWQYFGYYYLTFSYTQDTTLVNIEITSPIDLTFYEIARQNTKIPIIYLFGKTNSARILNGEVGLSIPRLYLFSTISLLLFLCSAFMLRYFLRTRKSF